MWVTAVAYARLTEKSYCRALREITDRYMAPMRESKWKELVPRIFSNVHMIVGINEELFAGLGELLKTWDANKVGSCASLRFVALALTPRCQSMVGPIFVRMAPFMRLYNTYGNSYNEAVGLLTKSKDKQDFVEFLQSCRAQQPLDLEALLIQPVQRIPRYRLLLEDLLKVPV